MNQLDQLPVPQVDKLVKLDMEYKERTMPIGTAPKTDYATYLVPSL